MPARLYVVCLAATTPITHHAHTPTPTNTLNFPSNSGQIHRRHRGLRCKVSEGVEAEGGSLRAAPQCPLLSLPLAPPYLSLEELPLSSQSRTHTQNSPHSPPPSFKPKASAEVLIGAFSELFSKFKAYETNLSNKRLTYQQKLPEIEKTLALVTHLKSKHEEGETITTQYNLCDTVYAKAKLDDSGTVNLWLGANVMLEYTYAEALEYLNAQEVDAKKEYKQVTEDLAFTRNQSITAEVNMSRIYNWDVKKRRDAKAMETAAAGK